uniref:Uncharacterized protein n=1 Tax=Azospirillum brasilense TaxID=192 RepID=P70729_AZOBR|nr:unknown [Azospirillum brasilense]
MYGSLGIRLRDDASPRVVLPRPLAARTTQPRAVLPRPGRHARTRPRRAERATRAFHRTLPAGRDLSVDIRRTPGASTYACLIDHINASVVIETAEIGDDVQLYHALTLGGTSWTKGRHELRDIGGLGAGAKCSGTCAVTTTHAAIGAGARVFAISVVVQDVPEGMTCCGIPGPVVVVRETQRPLAHGIDLDHHLMPDPVGKAIACLIDHINRIEARLEATRRRRPRAPPPPIRPRR